MTELDEQILIQLRRLNRDSPAFVVGLLSGELDPGEQIRFAHRLVDLAEAIRDRAIGPAGVVIEGCIDDSDTPEATSTAADG